MNKISHVLHCDGCTARLPYLRNVVLLASGKFLLDQAMLLGSPAESLRTTVAQAWLNPFVLVDPWYSGTLPTGICLTTFAFFSGLVWNSVHRAREAGWNHYLGLLAAVPFTNVMIISALLVWPKRRRPNVLDFP